MWPTPIPWKRRLRALLVGLLALQVLVFMRLALLVLEALSRPTPLALFHPGETGWNVISFSSEMLAKELFPGYLAPLIVWVLVSFRRADARILIGEVDAVR